MITEGIQELSTSRTSIKINSTIGFWSNLPSPLEATFRNNIFYSLVIGRHELRLITKAP